MSEGDQESPGGRTALHLIPITETSAIRSLALRARMELAPGVAITRPYLATAAGCDVALVVLDVWPRSDAVTLYELYVCPEQRGRGYGTAALLAVEGLARELGRARVELRPLALEGDRTTEELRAWYARHGYRTLATDEDMMEKAVRQE